MDYVLIALSLGAAIGIAVWFYSRTSPRCRHCGYRLNPEDYGYDPPVLPGPASTTAFYRCSNCGGGGIDRRLQPPPAE